MLDECVLAMIPLMMSFVAGRWEEKPGVLRALGFSAVFVVGLSITFTVMGIGRRARRQDVRGRLQRLELGAVGVKVVIGKSFIMPPLFSSPIWG